MSDLNAAQEVEFTVTQPDGTPVVVDGTACSDPSFTDRHDTTTGKRYIVANHAGSGTLHVWKGSQSGDLLVTVSEAPLVITLGTPQPK